MYRACASFLLLLLAACGSMPPGADRGAQPSEGAAETTSADAPAEEAVPPQIAQEFDRAVALAQSGEAAAAEQAFGALAQAHPQYSGPLVNLGILHAKAGRLEQAEQTLEQAIDRNPRNAAAFNQLGVVYRRLGRFKEADAAYQEALRFDPQHANAYLNLGVLCDLYLQQPQRALEAFERYLELMPDEKVSGWVRELRSRLGAGQRSARTQ